MLTEQDVRNAIAKSVINFDAASLDSDKDFTDAGLDSLDHANVLLFLQEEHNLTVPDSDLDQCTSIQAILEYSAKRNS